MVVNSIEAALGGELTLPPGRRSFLYWRVVFRLGLVLAHSVLLHLYALPFLPAYWLVPSLWRAVGDACQRSWSAWVLLLVPGIHLVIDQDAKDAAIDADDRPTLLTMNHQTDADWMVALALAERRCPGRLKIALKREIRSLPLMGSGANMFGFVWLARRWEEDKRSMAQQLGNLLTTMSKPMSLLIYPEGTTIHTEAVAKSHRFAEESKPMRPKFSNVLLPRTTGTTFAFKMMREAAAQRNLPPPRVVDLTVAYAGFRGEVPTYAMGYSRAVDIEVPNMLGYLDMPFGTQVKVHVSAREVSIADDAIEGGEWLDRVWERKERLLEAFKKLQEFPKEPDEARRSSALSEPSSLVAAWWPIAGAVVAAAALGGWAWRG